MFGNVRSFRVWLGVGGLMYGFLILLPLTLVSVLIGYFIASSTQVFDYVVYITELPYNAEERAQRIKEQITRSSEHWQLIASHLIAYSILCYAMIAAVRTISAPLPEDRPKGLRFFQIFLEAVFVAVPSLVLLWISGKAYLAEPDNRTHWLTAGILVFGLVASVTITATRRPLELFRSSRRPLSITKTDALAVISVVAIGLVVAVFFIQPLRSSYSFGIFPVLMLTTAVSIFAVAAVFSRHASPVAIISSAITAILFLHLLDTALPPREFRYAAIPLLDITKDAKPSVKAIKDKRQLLALSPAFQKWLEHRRPAIEEYSKAGRAFPIFFATAQGGGMYAAYHPALSLARLTDDCPEFARHLFGISSVSGGSLGAAVYAELLRTLPSIPENDPANPSAACTTKGGPEKSSALETRVNGFFKTDFLSPVIATALIFDVPSLVIPQLRFGHDRARALEDSFEMAWKRLESKGEKDGLAASFYERWQPEGRAPALFMSTTGVNFGIPVLVSQIDWSHNPFASRRAKAAPKLTRTTAVEPVDDAFLNSLHDRLRAPEEDPNAGVVNILDFRPDLQLATSTAVVLSARFPFVTPPGMIAANLAIARPTQGIFAKTRVLELTDGGFYDNSGAFVATDVIREMARLLDDGPEFKDFREKVRLHVIRFTDTPAKRQAEASEAGHFELITPLVAYDAVRLSRGVQLANPFGTAVFDVHLLDDWYDGTLNWLLSEQTMLAVQKRSSWFKGADNTECCSVKTPEIEKPRRIRLTPQQREIAVRENFAVDDFLPNQEQFEKVLELVKAGAERTAWHRRRPSAAQQ
jgi:hypothetical protein